MKTLKIFSILAILALSVGLTANQAAATLITSLPEGSVITMPSVNYFGQGPESMAPGVTWSSNNANPNSLSVFGYSGTYGFEPNGIWDGMTMAGLNTTSGTMTFAFASPVNAVGGFMNYAPATGTPTIAVYDAGMNLLESATLSFSVSGANAGQFLGFLENSNISFFTLTDAYIGITDLTVWSEPGNGDHCNPVPEPSTFILLGAGLLGLCIRSRMARK